MRRQRFGRCGNPSLRSGLVVVMVLGAGLGNRRELGGPDRECIGSGSGGAATPHFVRGSLRGRCLARGYLSSTFQYASSKNCFQEL